MLATNQDSEVSRCLQVYAVFIYLTKSPEAANCGRNILLLPAEDRPPVEFDPSLMQQMLPLDLPDFNPVRESKMETSNPKRTASNRLLPRHPIREENSHARGTKGGHLIVGDGSPKSVRQTSREERFEVLREGVEGFRQGNTTRERGFSRRGRSAAQEGFSRARRAVGEVHTTGKGSRSGVAGPSGVTGAHAEEAATRFAAVSGKVPSFKTAKTAPTQ